jgi:Holliday junction resolvase RusA-like endonuclease
MISGALERLYASRRGIGEAGMMTVEFRVEGEAVGKGRPRFAKRGGFVKVYTPAKTLAYEQRVAGAARVAMEGREPSRCYVSMSVVVRKAVPKSWSKAKREQAYSQQIFPKKPDVDNFAKAIMDSLNGIVYDDDVQVIELKVSKRWSIDECTTIKISEVVELIDDCIMSSNTRIN